MTDASLILAIPSKGRLMEKTAELFEEAGLTIRKTGHEREYRGAINDIEGVEVAFLSASEIALRLKTGQVHMGVTGEDLIREYIFDADDRIDFIRQMGFGQADVVVAIPNCWIDVSVMADLEDAAAIFHRTHGRRLRVATKYMNLTRRFFSEMGVTGYRIVESLGTTEGTPAAGTAELIVDITSTGSTLRANHLRVLDDGVILQSEANLVASTAAAWNVAADELRAKLIEKIAE